MYNEQFEAKHADLSAGDKEKMGKQLFLVQCAPCHGVTGDGLDGKAADLTKRISKESVAHVVRNGANNFKADYPGGMPPMMLSDDAQIDAVSEYVAAGFPEGHAGAEAFMMGGCTGCHGEKGEGIAFVGPRLNAWDTATVATVLKDGKKGAIGVMPAFDKLLPVQVDAVGTYLSNQN
jgi:cytochrome c oxidase cbb3-type subunit 3